VQKRIPQGDMEVIAGQQTAAGYLRMQKILGGFYFRHFFGVPSYQHPAGRILEIGPGSGYQTAEIAKRYPGVEIVAIEPSADMIAVARSYLAGRSLRGNVEFVQGFVGDEGLIVGLGEFDLVYSTFSLHHWSDPVQAYRNLYHALKSGRVLLLYDFELAPSPCLPPGYSSGCSWVLPLSFSPGCIGITQNCCWRPGNSTSSRKRRPAPSRLPPGIIPSRLFSI